MSHRGQSTQGGQYMSQDKSAPSALGAQWVRKSQSDSGGYLVFNLASVQCRYISLPITFDQSTQLVPGASSDTYYKGNQVWLKGTHLCTSYPMPKLRPKRFGPFEVIKKLSSVTYQLVLPPSWKLHNAFHATLLSPYWEIAMHGRNYLRLTPKLIKGELEWEVESIVATWQHRHKRGLQFFIKWVGYPESNNSWELAENVHVLALVQNFYKKCPAAMKGIKVTQPLAKEGISLKSSIALHLHLDSTKLCWKSHLSPASTTLPTQMRRVLPSLLQHCSSPPLTMTATHLGHKKVCHWCGTSMPMTADIY